VVVSGSSENASVSAVIEFNFAGIEEGLNPLGNTFDPSRIKAPRVLADAIAATGIDVDQFELSDSIDIIGVMPADFLRTRLALQETAVSEADIARIMDNLAFHPNRYIVTINNVKALGLSARNAEKLLDEILTQYRAFFRSAYGGASVLPANFGRIGGLGEYDYIEIYDIFAGQINALTDYLRQKTNEDPLYRDPKTNLTFAAFNNNIRTLEADLARLEAQIVGEAISRGGADNREATLKYLGLRRAFYQAEAAMKGEEADILWELIDNFAPTVIVIPLPNGGTHEVINATDSEYYEELIAKYIRVSRELLEAQARIPAFDARIFGFEEANAPDLSEEDYAKAEAAVLASISRINNLINAQIDGVNEMVSEYLDTQIFGRATRTAVPAQYSRNITGFRWVLIAVALAVLAGAGAAMVTTHVLEERKKKV
jgi:hypothetical protein